MKIKPAHIGLILIAIMFLSTVSFGFIQAGFFSPQEQQRQTQETPTPRVGIVEGELSSAEENIALGSGITVIKFRYNINCQNCLQVQQIMEALTTNSVFSGQVLLEEINDPSVTSPRASVFSFYGQREITNFTENEIIGVMCDLVVNPPALCAVRGVQ